MQCRCPISVRYIERLSVRKFLALVVIVLAGCSGPTDPVITKAFEIIEGAYVLELKPTDASYAKCKYIELESRHIAQCGFSFGGANLERVGFWELLNKDGQPEIYAMNGDALRALEKLSLYKEFKSGVGHRSPLNIEEIKLSDGF